MSHVGQIERRTQDQVTRLFRDALGYACLGGWHRREGNCNVEEGLLSGWLTRRAIAAQSLMRFAGSLHSTDSAG